MFLFSNFWNASLSLPKCFDVSLRHVINILGWRKTVLYFPTLATLLGVLESSGGKGCVEEKSRKADMLLDSSISVFFDSCLSAWK